MNTVKSAFAVAGVAAALIASPATANPPPPPPPPVSMNNCNPSSLTLTVPNADDCVGYYSGNVLNGSSSDVTAQQAAVTLLGGSFDGNFGALPVITTLSGGSTNEINFGQTLFGDVIIGIHWGNVPDPFVNPNNNGTTGNVSVFYLFDLTTPTDFITLANTQGFSNAVLYENTGGVPEPATWAMMVMGFGAAGFAIRRRRRRKELVSQLA